MRVRGVLYVSPLGLVRDSRNGSAVNRAARVRDCGDNGTCDAAAGTGTGTCDAAAGTGTCTGH